METNQKTSTNSVHQSTTSNQKNRKKKKNFVASTIKGSFLANEKVRQNFPFFIFLAILAMFYIFNNYMAEKFQRSIKKIQPIHEAYLTNYRNAEAQFTDSAKLSNISKNLISIGLKEARVSPKVITANTENEE
ncbi:MAG: FtsL-like putative cell division protein [Bacteroidales bacterium]|nr:FtsL-like putative cell division protein [Bacteroidales bacterium]